MEAVVNLYKTEKKNKYNVIELINNNGVSVKAIDLGGIITEINTPDRNGNIENIVLSYDDYDSYLVNPSFLGALIGRSAGRIGDGKVKIDGVEYMLDKNDGNNTLHGGFNGFNFKTFSFETFKNSDSVGVEFSYLSKDGEGNFPGEIKVKVIYTLNNENEFKISYEGISNKKTILNMTNHTYFNLSGNCKRKVTDHTLLINSDKIAELDNESIVTGKIIDVTNTPFDFRSSKKLGKDINEDDYQLNITKGYDHYFKFNNHVKDEKVAELYDENSGRGLCICTNCDGIVVYSCNYKNEGRLSIGRNIDFRDAVCLETQNIPIGRENLFIEDSIINANEVYSKETTYKFIVK